jgi:hypothetical protein
MAIQLPRLKGIASARYFAFSGPNMKRKMNTLIGMVFCLFSMPLALSQDGSPQPCPGIISGPLGCELVAWSHLQEPVPLPEPDTEPAPQSSRQSIMGFIVRQGEKFVLKDGRNAIYKLDDQSRVRSYQDKRVKVLGRLDSDGSTFHVEGIESVS